MARTRKVYTQEEVNAMTEKRMLKLFEDGRIDDDMVQRWYDNQEEIKQIVSDAEEEFKANIEGTNNPTESEEVRMERANRCTVQAIEEGYEVRFYRTHKYIGSMTINTDNKHSNELRESARVQAINGSATLGIEWNPKKQVQAWERKYNTYMTNEQVSEDAITLLHSTIERLVEKCKYDMELIDIEMSAIEPRPSNLSYVEHGRYSKSGAWCTADVEMSIKVHCIDQEMDILFPMEIKSGQICKPKTTIAEWNAMVLTEIGLNGIEIPNEEEVSE